MLKEKYEIMMFEDYESRYKFDAEKVVDYYMFDNTQLIVELEDGSKILYDYMEKTIRYLRRPGSSEENDMSEEKWRYEFSQRLRKKMQLRGYGQDTLSQETGISRVTISHYMTGKSIPNLYNANKIANALKCNVIEFIRFPK